ncbi:hypothetical protein NB706_003496 [Xanthomonas sacchari]|nr:hypothetical protein [Xanthomonas sacchari]
MRLRTLATRMVCRVRVTSNGLATLSRAMVSTTLLPGSPRSGSIALTALIGLPSMAMMMSPERRPARAAGVSSIGDTTLSVLSGNCSNSTPMPS